MASASCALELSAPRLSAQAAYELVSKRASASLVLPLWTGAGGGSARALTAALSVGYDVRARALTSRAAKLACELPGAYTLTAFASDAPAQGGGRLCGASVHALGAGGVRVATELRLPEGGRPALASALSAPIPGGAATAKARLGTDGLLCVSLRHSLGAGTAVTLAGRVGLSLDPVTARCGVHLALER